MKRTIKSVQYTPSAERTDGQDWLLGDVTYITFEECDHVSLGNPATHFKVGSQLTCSKCQA